MKRPLVSSLLLTLAACTAEPAPVVPAPPTPTARPVLGKVDLGRVPEGHTDVAALRVVSRGPRRLSVDQLERSLDQLGQLPEGTVKFPESLAVTLGRPDYVRLNAESLEASPLFMKFMLDLGAIVCGQLIASDPQRPVEDRALTRYEDVDRNIDDLLLRLTGIDGEAAAPYRARLASVYREASTSPRGAAAGWEAVCIAVLTSPEFLLY